MNQLRSPQTKLILALALLAGLGLCASSSGFSLVTASRWILGLSSLAGLAFWMHRQKPRTPGFDALPRLTVLARTGLSPKCSLALVEADGRTLLVAFGDGFAQFADAPAEAAPTQKVQAKARRVAPKSRRPRKVVSP